MENSHLVLLISLNPLLEQSAASSTVASFGLKSEFMAKLVETQGMGNVVAVLDCSEHNDDVAVHYQWGSGGSLPGAGHGGPAEAVQGDRPAEGLGGQEGAGRTS